MNNCAIFEQIDEKINIKTDFGNKGVESIEKLLLKVNLLQPKSLKLSNDMIRTKETLKNQIYKTTAIIQQAISRKYNIKSHIEMIVFHRDQIEKYKKIILK